MKLATNAKRAPGSKQLYINNINMKIKYKLPLRLGKVTLFLVVKGVVAQSPEPGTHDINAGLFFNTVTLLFTSTIFAEMNSELNVQYIAQ